MPKLIPDEILVLLALIVVLSPQISADAIQDMHKPLLKPGLKFKTLPEYQAECKEPSVMLDSDFVMMFAPKAKKKKLK